MDLLTRLQDDMKTAMKSGQKDRLTVIRMLISDVKNVGITSSAAATPEGAIDAYAKKLRKSAEEYENLGKPDEIAKLKAELTIVEEYLPQKASTEDTARLVDAFLAKNTFTEKQLGQATGTFMKAHGKEVDGAQANALLKQRLTGK